MYCQRFTRSASCSGYGIRGADGHRRSVGRPGTLQSLSAQELPTACASLIPNTFSSFTQAAAGGVAANSNNLQLRMQTMRLASAANSLMARSVTNSS